MQYSVPIRIAGGGGRTGQITHVLVEARKGEDAIEAAKDLLRLTGREPRDLILEGGGPRLLNGK